MSDIVKFVGDTVKSEFNSFWDYVNEVQRYAIEITEDCSSFDDLPTWNRLLIFAFCANTWDYDRLTEEMTKEQISDMNMEIRMDEKIKTAKERAALKRKIRSLQKQLERAKENAKTKKAATINKE